VYPSYPAVVFSHISDMATIWTTDKQTYVPDGIRYSFNPENTKDQLCSPPILPVLGTGIFALLQWTGREAGLSHPPDAQLKTFELESLGSIPLCIDRIYVSDIMPPKHNSLPSII
jgi:hypothetical protein